MAVPPPPYADAVTGLPLAGEAVTGTWFAWSFGPGIALGANPPVIDIYPSGQTPPAGLKLGAWLPTHGTQVVVSASGLKLGAYPAEARLNGGGQPLPAGLLLGAVAPAYRSSSSLPAPPGGLLLGGETPAYAGQQPILPVYCVDVDLEPVSCEPSVLVGAVTSISLQGAPDSALVLEEAEVRSVSLAGVE